MKVAKLSNLKKMFSEDFAKRLESVDRARRGEDMSGDYHDENEGDGVSYEEDVDRLRRADDGYGETEFEESLDEESLEETNLYSDADKKGGDESDKKGKGHAHPSDAADFYPGAIGEGKFPSLKQIFSEGNLSDISPSWEKRINKTTKVSQ